MALGFIKTYRGAAGQLITTDPKAYLLLSLIGLRARREDDNSGITNLKANQAYIGDYKKLGLTRDCYRGAIKRLVKRGLITVDSTRRGTIATLTSIAIHDINAQEFPFQYPSQLSMENTQPYPSEPQPLPTPSPVTRKEKDIRRTTTTQINLYPCLLQAELSDADKRSLMQYPEERVQAALLWLPSITLKKTAIEALHWHCRQSIPPQPSQKSGSFQETLAKEFNDFLHAHGYTELTHKNETAIKEGYIHVIDGGRETTVSLKNPVERVKEDIKQSRTYIERIARYSQG